jgi:hypothetical protein
MVQITGNYQNGQDVLSFANTANITGVWTAGTGLLTLSGPDTVANYQAALRSVTYQNTSSIPWAGDRTVSFVVSDGAASSNTVTRTLTVTATTTQWTGAVDDHWENAANWTAGVAPGSGLKAILDGTPTSRMPKLYADSLLAGLDIRTAGWTVSLNGHTLSLGADGLDLPGGSTPTSSVDVGTGVLIVANPTANVNLYEQIQGWVGTARGTYNSGNHSYAYDGGGITSAAVVADQTDLGLGVVDNAYTGAGIHTRTALTSLNGVTVQPTDIVVRFTSMGDIDLNGSTNTVDYSAFKAYYSACAVNPDHGGLPLTTIGWQTGDLNLDGITNQIDYVMFKAGYSYSAVHGLLASGSLTPLMVLGGGTSSATASPGRSPATPVRSTVAAESTLSTAPTAVTPTDTLLDQWKKSGGSRLLAAEVAAPEALADDPQADLAVWSTTDNAMPGSAAILKV